MIIKIFRENQPLIVLLSFLILVLVWIRVGFHEPVQPDSFRSYYSTAFYLFPSLKALHNLPAICSLLNISLVVLCGSFLTSITTKFQVIPNRTSLPMFIMLVVSMPYFSHYNGFSFSLVTLLALLVVINMLFSSTADKGISYSFFDSALLLSIMSLINFYIIIYILFILFVLFQVKGYRWREFVFICLGTLLPYFLLVCILYLLNMDVSGWVANFIAGFTKSKVNDYSTLVYWIGILSVTIFIFSSYRILRNYMMMKVATRKYAVIFFGLFILTLLIYFFYPALDKDFLLFLALPISFLFSYYFATCQINLFNQILFVLFLGSNLAVLVFG